MQALILCLCFADAADPAKVTPAVVPTQASEVPAAVDALVTLTAPGGVAAQWELASELKAGFWPDGAACRVTSSTPGRVMVLCFVGGETVRYVVSFDGAAPMPGPGPKPVDPPGPVPVDSLKAAMTAAFNADPGTMAERRADALKLASLYAAGAAAAKNAKLTTAQAVLDTARAAGAAMPDPLAATALPGVRKVFAAELVTVLGKDLSATMTAANRDTAAGLFKRAEGILEGLGK